MGILCSRLCYYLRRCFTIAIKELAINTDIKFKEVRVIDSDGKQLGILPIAKALDAAYAKDLDLVCVSSDSQPPVCKIIDYGKFRFEQIKRDKEAKKNQKVIETKEVWLSMTIDVGDLNVKAKQAQKFLSQGNKVKVSIRMRGRQMAHSELGLDVMKKFYEIVKDYGQIEKNPQTEGRNIWMK